VQEQYVNKTMLIDQVYYAKRSTACVKYDKNIFNTTHMEQQTDDLKGKSLPEVDHVLFTSFDQIVQLHSPDENE